MNNKTYEFDYDETVTSAGTVAGRIVSYDIVFSDPVPTDNASLITSGTLSDARLSNNVPLKNTANIFTQNQTINGDVEVTDSTKGIILKSGNNTRWRITITDSGTLQRVALSILAALAIVSSSTAQTVTDVVVGTNGVLVAPTNFFTANLPNWSTSTNPAQARTNLGLGSAATNDSSAFQPASVNLTNLASNNAINLTNFPALLLRTNGSAAGLTSFPTLIQNTTGSASNVTGVVAITNGGTGTNTAGGARTNLELGVTNNVTFSNITASGTFSATGNATLSGVNNTAPSQTASSGASLMTRDLVDDNPLWAFHAVRPLGAFDLNANGTGSGAGFGYAFGGAYIIAGSSLSGFGEARVYRGVNDASGLTGAGIYFSQNITVAAVVSFIPKTNSVFRLVVGAPESGSPAPANANAITNRGFGVEVEGLTSSTSRMRLFAHDGTNYSTSSYTSTLTNGSQFQNHIIVDNTTNGTVSLYLSVSPINKSPSRPSTTPVLTMTGGPTNSFGGSFVNATCVNSSNASSDGFFTVFYGGMLEVR